MMAQCFTGKLPTRNEAPPPKKCKRHPALTTKRPDIHFAALEQGKVILKSHCC
jgi:hypothetical protein